MASMKMVIFTCRICEEEIASDSEPEFEREIWQHFCEMHAENSKATEVLFGYILKDGK
jgi:hypothetical protein